MEDFKINSKEILMGRDKDFPLTQELEDNLMDLLIKINKFRNIYGKPMVVSSGYRPGVYNKNANGASKSKHMTLQACDFIDLNGDLDEFCVNNKDVLKECGLYLEHPYFTPTWCHLQSIPPSSNSLIFYPYSVIPKTAKFDKKFIHLLKT